MLLHMDVEIVDLIREKSIDHNYELPPLVPEQDKLKGMWQTIFDILEPILEPFFNLARSGLEHIPFGPVFKFLAPVLFLLLVLYLVWLLWRLYQSKASEGLPPSSLVHPNKITHRSISEELSLALVHGDYALALRLRWRLFLQQHRLLECLTPYECYDLGKISEVLVNRLYRGMFSAQRASKELFDSIDKDLVAALQPDGSGGL